MVVRGPATATGAASWAVNTIQAIWFICVEMVKLFPGEIHCYIIKGEYLIMIS